MSERLPEHPGGPDGTVEGTAFWLMTFLEPSRPDDCRATVKLMERLIPLYCENYMDQPPNPSG